MLTKEQKTTLETIFNSGVKNIAAWGGGTALSEIYLHHRLSDDIDIILSDLPAGDILTALSNQVRAHTSCVLLHNTSSEPFRAIFHNG